MKNQINHKPTIIVGATTTLQVPSFAFVADLELRCLRAASTGTLLAYQCNQGILFYDRRADGQCILTWSALKSILPVELQ